MGLYPKCGESDGGDMSHSEIFFLKIYHLSLTFGEKMGLPLLVSIKYPVAKKWHLTVRHLFREHAQFHGVL